MFAEALNGIFHFREQFTKTSEIMQSQQLRTPEREIQQIKSPLPRIQNARHP